MSGLNMLDTIADPEFYESIDYYQPRSEEFLDLVTEMVPSDWQFMRVNGIWFGCLLPEGQGRPTPPQGWKIHVSSSLAQSRDVLKAVVPVLTEHCVSFKFSLDLTILALMNNKRWSRQGSGKFITIYPVDETQFVFLVEELHKATRALEGPYILSDRRYKDSKVVFYRYGGIRPESVLNARGEKVPMLTSPSGERVPDIRRPYFYLPEWAKDPLEDTSATDGNADSEEQLPSRILLKDGRYSVKSVLTYSNSGGVYMAEDLETGQDVVIKEARPFIDATEDTIFLLKKEYRILSKIAHLRIAPQPLDFFQDWEHFFMVQEYLKGNSLADFASRHNVTLIPRPTLADTESFYGKFRRIILQLADIVKAIHEHGIVFSDLSPNNLILTPETLELKIIDFEGAHEMGVDKPGLLFTPGFAADQMFGRTSTFESDYFSLGAIIHFFLSPVNQIFLINPKARFSFLQTVTKDIGFPKSICEMATALVDKEAEKRPTPAEVIEVLQRDDKPSTPDFAVNGREADPTYRNDVSEITRYILGVATYERKDRLFPSDGAIFHTNPLSLAYGACGVAYALKKMDGKVPGEVVDWIAARNKNTLLYPPGLYTGLAGIAWGMLELGMHDESQQALISTFDHPLVYNSFDLFYGASGWGLANLRFFMEFQDEMYLDKAEEAGRYLLDTVAEDTRGCYWTSKDEIPLGYAYGASGVSLFLLYLYLAGGKEEFLEIGKKAVDFDINCASSQRGGKELSWRRLADKGSVLYPYWIYGAAGVGMAVLRYYRLLEEERYRETLEKIFIETARKYTVFPGFFKGLSGLGEFLLDLYQVTNDNRHLDGAYRVATGISLFKIERKKGLAFPGEMLRRISCDYGTGSAGVGHFLHRLTHPDESAFHLDRLFLNTEELSEVC
ncbi:MAG: class III lanthionine synthetase LanKC [Acidobacteriota bacterium]